MNYDIIQQDREPTDEQTGFIDVNTTFEDGLTFVYTINVLKSSNEIVLSSVLQELKQKGLCFDNSIISYITRDGHKFNCWCEPIPDSFLIPESETFMSLEGRETLKLFITKLDQASDGTEDSTQDEQKAKRSKERTIAEVTSKVEIWKKVYNELKQINAEAKNIAEKAAEYVSIPKKSLDDYLHQLKLGKKYGFKFEKHGRSKIGRLRKYNKRHGAKEKEEVKVNMEGQPL